MRPFAAVRMGGCYFRGNSSDCLCVDKALSTTFTMKLLEPCLRTAFLPTAGALLLTCKFIQTGLKDVRICSSRSATASHVLFRF